MTKKKERATELEWLKYFYINANFGPAHELVVFAIEEDFKEETGKSLPESYGVYVDEEDDE